MSLFRPTAVLAVTALSLAAPRLRSPRPQGPAETLDRASRVFKQAKTVRATFEQTLKNPLTGTEARATGEIVLQQPNRMAVNFTNPAGDRVVSDGKWLWVYLPSTAPNQVIKLPAKSQGISGVDMVGELLTAPTARYRVADAGAATIGGRATHAVTLTPKADGGPIDKAVVWVDDADASLRQFEVTDANGLVRTVRMISWTANATIPSASFRFTVPNGVRVVDQAALGGR
jgi:outer membrane lipoprotein carrier protein